MKKLEKVDIKTILMIGCLSVVVILTASCDFTESFTAKSTNSDPSVTSSTPAPEPARITADAEEVFRPKVGRFEQREKPKKTFNYKTELITHGAEDIQDAFYYLPGTDRYMVATFYLYATSEKARKKLEKTLFDSTDMSSFEPSTIDSQFPRYTVGERIPLSDGSQLLILKQVRQQKPGTYEEAIWTDNQLFYHIKATEKGIIKEFETALLSKSE